MNSEHLYDLRESHTGWRRDANGRLAGLNTPPDALQDALSDAWAVGMVLAAYDHVLFHPWRPGEEGMWAAALQELLTARDRILAELIPMRLRQYRERVPARVARAYLGA